MSRGKKQKVTSVSPPHSFSKSITIHFDIWSNSPTVTKAFSSYLPSLLYMPLNLCHLGRQLCWKAKKPEREGKPSGPLKVNNLHKARRLGVFRRQLENLHVSSLCSVQSPSVKAPKSWPGIPEIRLPHYSEKPICPMAFAAHSPRLGKARSHAKDWVNILSGKKPLCKQMWIVLLYSNIWVRIFLPIKNEF